MNYIFPLWPCGVYMRVCLCAGHAVCVCVSARVYLCGLLQNFSSPLGRGAKQRINGGGGRPGQKNQCLLIQT